MTDEALSELAEALQDACDDWIRHGGKIGKHAGCICPFAALLKPIHPICPSCPGAISIGQATGIPGAVVRGIVAGFDNRPPAWPHDERAEQIGRQLREQYA